MKQSAGRLFLLALILIIAGITVGVSLWPVDNAEKAPLTEQSLGEFGEEFEKEGYGKIQTKMDRSRYFFRKLKNPATNAIPPDIRERELNLARQQPTRSQYPIQYKRKDGTVAALEFEWEATGPFDVGGRTRALGIDQDNPNTIIAGGVSGGIWKSTDGGDSWELKTDPTQHMSVTSLAQDTTSPDTWYYTSGELRGNTASDRGGTAPYFGTGVYISTDNGESWDQIPQTDENDTQFNNPYDFLTRVVVSPVTGSVFVASNGFGIYRSTDTQPFPDAQTEPDPLLGAPGGHRFCDIAVGSDGRLIATLSAETATSGSVNANPGVFVSYNDGDSWTDITSEIENYPTNTSQRSVIDIAPSAPDTAYIMTYVGGSDSNEDVRLHFVDLNNLQGGGQVESEDRSANIPDFGGDVGYMITQSNYNMEIAVKPDDPDFVMIGGTNLFRSTDGFSTSPAGGYDEDDKNAYWIGGYSKENNIASYPRQHPDQHVLKFHPNNPNIVWAGHDGGLSQTLDIEEASVSWENKNNGYVTTQFYALDLPQSANDDRIMGGTQDNGTPYFRYDSQQRQQNQPAVNIFTGDGGYSFFTPSNLFVSAQNGVVLKWDVTSEGNPKSGSFSYVYPSEAKNQLFIHPYAVDPNDQSIMYYPDGDSLWRNTEVSSIYNTNAEGSQSGWHVATQVNSSSTGYLITALEISKSPSDVLYYGAYSTNNQKPLLYRLENASSSSNAQDISIPDATIGSYPHDIAVNPSDGDELVAVFSNYEVPSIFHSTDGGETWQDIEGNLNGVNNNAGPSVRSATIIQGETGTIYLLGTSTGIYSTTSLNGSSTQWIQEAENSIGYTVTEYLASRSIDGTVVAGTHGRGVYKGHFQGAVIDNRSISLNQSAANPGQDITITSTNFAFSTTPEENFVRFNDAHAEVVEATQNQLTVEVPRIINRVQNNVTGSNNLVQVRVTVNGQTVSSPTFFEILPPLEFELRPNFPNPFNPTTTIPFDIPNESGVIIQIFDISGQKVMEPVRRVFEPSSYNVEVDLSGLASGVYIYRVVVVPQDDSGESTIKTGKMTLIK